jgi:hypothetical protein
MPSLLLTFDSGPSINGRRFTLLAVSASEFIAAIASEGHGCTGVLLETY